MSNQPMISVIVPCYKVEEYLPRCVDSVLAQTYPNLEIILVDDGSPDASGQIAEDYAAKDSRIRVIHKQNGGLSSARNAGLDVAAGEYVSFIDSDDWIEPDTYEAMLTCAEKFDVKLVVAGRFDVEGETQTVGLCPEREECISGQELVGRIFRWDHLDSAAWDKLYARELFREIRYPVGRLSEDVPTTYRLALLAGRVGMLPKPVYHYVHRPNTITTTTVITERTFHNVQNTARVYADICESLPVLERDARYFRIQSLVYTMILLEQADATSRERFSRQYSEIREELQGHLPFLYRYPLFSLREKLQNTLLAFGLYPAFRSVYHFMKRQKV